MPLPQFFRIIVTNNSGRTVTFNNNGRFNLKVTFWHIDPDTGKTVYTQDVDDNLAFIAGDSTIDGAEEKSSEIDNIAGDTEFLGAHVQLEVTHDEGTLADGNFNIYLDGGDAAGELASDAGGYTSAEADFLQHIGSLAWIPGADDDTRRSEVIEI
ncbi:hypothetical protein LCGC14_0248930 [marine sediment metagenome]|uniref:Uncharacterized protein n=1 Tax=marine sediment metagenome TaxID=412755 RepID=A0A0F9WQ78_9ZZZZ